MHRGSLENSINKEKSLCSWPASHNLCLSTKARETSSGQKDQARRFLSACCEARDGEIVRLPPRRRL